MPPTLANGKICYVEIPSTDVERSHASEPGLLGGIVQPIGTDAPKITARFRDPAGNVIGLYQRPA
jgi:hypothetical protein